MFFCAVDLGFFDHSQLHRVHRSLCFRYKINVLDISFIERNCPVRVIVAYGSRDIETVRQLHIYSYIAVDIQAFGKGFLVRGVIYDMIIKVFVCLDCIYTELAFDSRSRKDISRSVIAYNEGVDAKKRRQYMYETEVLAILSGLEIDAAKTGVRPDLSDYRGKKIPRTPFLKYKTMVEDAEERREWYEDTLQQKLDKFFADTDWEKVDSPVERLPLLARELKKGTRPAKGKKATDAQLFIFAQEKDWKSKLNSGTLERVAALLDDYERCLKHIRSCRSPSKENKRKADIERVLYRRGREDAYDTDELYALFQTVDPEHLTKLRSAIHEEFPDFVDAGGNGWYIRHIRTISIFAQQKPKLVKAGVHKYLVEKLPDFEAKWRDKVRQFQIPIFLEHTDAIWQVRFDDVIANALTLGPLREMEAEVTEQQKEKLLPFVQGEVKLEYLTTLVAYYQANKPEDSDWVVLPSTNFNCYFGSRCSAKRY